MTTVVITGASMGIGRALAVEWARRGATVVLSARGQAALEEVANDVTQAGGRPIIAPGDVTNEADRIRLIERCEGRIDVLVNNAGRGFYAPAMKIDIDELRRLFDLNVFAPLRLVQLAEGPLERARGTVVMMSSIAGVVAAPKYGAYSATKFALEGVSMAMRSELAARGIRIVVIRPGPVQTSFRANAIRSEGIAGYRNPDPKAQSPEDVALLTIRAVDRARAVVETSNYVRLASAATRLLPPAVRVALRRMAN